jgi:hypothetical protein
MSTRDHFSIRGAQPSEFLGLFLRASLPPVLEAIPHARDHPGLLYGRSAHSARRHRRGTAKRLISKNGGAPRTPEQHRDHLRGLA